MTAYRLPIPALALLPLACAAPADEPGGSTDAGDEVPNIQVADGV